MKNKCLYCYQIIEENKDFHTQCSSDFFGSKTPPKIEYSLEQMNELAKQTIERRISVPGVQAKLSLSIKKKTKNETQRRHTVVGALGGQYIFKPPSARFPEMPANEHLTMRIAEEFGIDVVPSSLIRLKFGELSYITKRIDRTPKGEKIHMIDMFQITESFDKYKSSMEKIGRALNEYSSNIMLDKLNFFELTLFSFLTGNNDMHLKNFSMIKAGAIWKLAPAYDLLNVSIVNPTDKEELALTLFAKKKKLKTKHFIDFGKGMGLTDKQVDGVFHRFFKNKPKAIKLIEKSFLSKEMKTEYKSLLIDRYKRLATKKEEIEN